MPTVNNALQQQYLEAYSQSSRISGTLSGHHFDFESPAAFPQLLIFLDSKNKYFVQAPLRKIDFDYCSLDDDKIQQLINVLSGHSSLEHINLRGNLIADKGAVLLDKFIETSRLRNLSPSGKITIDVRDNPVSETYDRSKSNLVLDFPEADYSHFSSEYVSDESDEDNESKLTSLSPVPSRDVGALQQQTQSASCTKSTKESLQDNFPRSNILLNAAFFLVKKIPIIGSALFWPIALMAGISYIIETINQKMGSTNEAKEKASSQPKFSTPYRHTITAEISATHPILCAN